MKKYISVIIMLALTACAIPQTQATAKEPEKAKVEAPAQDKIQARLKVLEPLEKQAIEALQKTPQWADFEAKRKIADESGEKVKETEEWKKLRGIQVEKEYLLKLSK